MRHEDKQRLRMFAGNLSGLYGIRDVTFNEGRAKGVRAFELRTDKGLECTILADRCLDIAYLSYKGVNMGLVLKPGISAPAFFTENGKEGFLSQFNGGLLTTCGLLNAGPPDTINGRAHGLHGTIANIPAEGVRAYEDTDRDEVTLRVQGTMYDAVVFGQCLALRRSITVFTESNTIRVDDIVENQGFEDQLLMNLYHANFGYPFLDAGAKCYFSAPEVKPRDDAAAARFADYAAVEAPEIGRPEECFYHYGAVGFQFALMDNPNLKLAAAVHYDADNLPYLGQWKCCHAGDYAMGLEPGIACFFGLAHAMEHNLARVVKPGQAVKLSICFEILDDQRKIEDYKKRCKEHKD